MPSQVVSLIRAAYDAMNADDPAWAAANLPPDFELVPPPSSGGLAERYTGAGGIAQFRAELEDAWEAFHTEVEEIVEFGERVVVLGRIRNRGRGSGLEVDVVAAHLWTLRDGVPVRVELIGDRDEALRRAQASGEA